MGRANGVLLVLAASTFGLVGFERPQRGAVQDPEAVVLEPCAAELRITRHAPENSPTTRDQLSLILCKLGYKSSVQTVHDSH